MKIEEIEITIGADGKLQLHSFGFTGDTCIEATKDLEALLGNRLVSRERTAETWDKPSNKTAEKINIHA